MPAKTTAQNSRSKRASISCEFSQKKMRHLRFNGYMGESKNKWNILRNKNNVIELINPVNTDKLEYFYKCSHPEKSCKLTSELVTNIFITQHNNFR